VPSEFFKRIDLDLVHPSFLEKVLRVVASCRDLGHHYVATYGFRTEAEQAKLYFQGRTLPGRKVTNARPGYSVHNYGAAIDFVADADINKPGLQPDWAEKAYACLATQGRAEGLQVGVPGLADPGHVQLPLTAKLKRQEVAILNELHACKTLADAWAKIDAWGPW
jgi:hypothetical protein